MFFPEIEKKSAVEIKQYQEQRLSDQLEYLAAHSPFYKEHFRKHNIDTRTIKLLEDLRRIPVTTKDDLQHSNEAFLCVGREKIIDYITTSGTIGEPVTFGMTEHDLDRLAYCEAISFMCGGHMPGDVYQLMTTMDRRFMAGLAYFMGVRKLGAGIVRVGSGIPELQWESIMRFKPTTLITVPSFILRLVEFAEANGIDHRSSSITKAMCIGEPLRNSDFTLNSLGAQIQEKWGIKLFSTYASTEMEGGFTECEAGIGGHHHPELIIVELLDEHDEAVAPGTPGEVTITTLGVEGMPLLRFKTGDICYQHTEPCPCGRNTLRLGPVFGRRQHMIKYKGTTLYPSSLYDVLDGISGVTNYVVEVSTSEIGTDHILVRIGSTVHDDAFEKKIKDHFRTRLRVVPSLVFESPESVNRVLFPATSRKPVKFVDKRD
ncbi:MAG: AMP-binding protein [Bacteroidota bacterium]